MVISVAQTAPVKPLDIFRQTVAQFPVVFVGEDRTSPAMFIEHYVFLTLTKLYSYINPTRPYTQYCHIITLNERNIHLKYKLTAPTYPWSARTLTTDMYAVICEEVMNNTCFTHLIYYVNRVFPMINWWSCNKGYNRCCCGNFPHIMSHIKH